MIRNNLKRMVGSLTIAGFIGCVVFMLVALGEIFTGHANDPVPTGWLIEAFASFGAAALGTVGFVVGLSLGEF